MQNEMWINMNNDGHKEKCGFQPPDSRKMGNKQDKLEFLSARKMLSEWSQ